MALQLENSVTINTYDMTHVLRNEVADEIFKTEFKKWDWIERLTLNEASQYFYSHITQAEEQLQSYDLKNKNNNNVPNQQQIDLRYYVHSQGELGQFVFQTIAQHGELVAFYILDIAAADSHKNPFNSNRSEVLKRLSTYEYHLAHFLFFQHINAGDYIHDNNKRKLKSLMDDFSNSAKNSLEEIRTTSDTASKLLKDTSRELDQRRSRSKRRALVVLQRYKMVFKRVREEADKTKKAATEDLKNAYNTYHAQVDLKSSIIYWNEKAAKYGKYQWKWLLVVAASIALTFASPVIYYAMGGASALAAKRHENITQNLNTPKTPEGTNESELPATSEAEKKQEKSISASDTTEKLAFASGIADLTGAALIVALMSVLLRLSLRQYNTSIFLSHDAEERVTMLKTYLALSNEGKLTKDGDMKLVLEALFRPSQPNSIPDTAPATPIELIVKAITEKK